MRWLQSMEQRLRADTGSYTSNAQVRQSNRHRTRNPRASKRTHLEPRRELGHACGKPDILEVHSHSNACCTSRLEPACTSFIFMRAVCALMCVVRAKATPANALLARCEFPRARPLPKASRHAVTCATTAAAEGRQVTGQIQTDSKRCAKQIQKRHRHLCNRLPVHGIPQPSAARRR